MLPRHRNGIQIKQIGRFDAIVIRLLDVTLGLFGLLLSTPIILIAALAIWFETPGDPFFLQTRVGLGGELFRIYKLRGMYIDARQRFPHLYNYQRYGDLKFFFHYPHDPRITKVGEFIRRTSIDELPNFLNVIRGEMSLVGPRPEVPEVEVLYGKYSNKYLSVKPGITCISKITGRDYLTKEETIKLDLEYVDQMSLRLNAKIMWVTFERVLFHRDVFYKRGPQKESTMVHSEDDNIELTLADKNSRASSRAASM